MNKTIEYTAGQLLVRRPASAVEEDLFDEELGIVLLVVHMMPGHGWDGDQTVKIIDGDQIVFTSARYLRALYEVVS